MTSIVDQKDERDFSEAVRLFLQGRMDADTFRKVRLLHGVYAQRQPDQFMLRVRIPWGGLNSHQIERIADLADAHAAGTSHVTTRQNLQFYGMNLKQASEMIHDLAEVGVTTREASGNVVRNITACHLASVCRKELFDVTPYADRLTRSLIRHPDFQHLPRKFKISFSGCRKDCGFTLIQDLGFVADQKNGKNGFKVFVGGGLGAVPRRAQALEDFIPDTLLVSTTFAVLRVFNRYGNRAARARARLKFLIERMGLEEFRAAVFHEREGMELTLPDGEGEPPAGAVGVGGPREGQSPVSSVEFLRWKKTNIEPQKQSGFFAVPITVPLGDITSNQLRVVGQISEKFSNGSVRTTNGQNLVLFWIRETDLSRIYDFLKDSGLGMPCAHRLCDITTCPGASSCPAAITNSKALAAELIRFFQNGGRPFQEFSGALKICGCQNGCGQHRIGTIGLSGRSQTVNGKQIPCYEIYLGAHVGDDESRFAEPVCKIPARRVPIAISRILHWYRKKSQPEEPLCDFVQRKGARSFKAILDSLLDLEHLPLLDVELKDWGEEKDFQLQVHPSEC